MIKKVLIAEDQESASLAVQTTLEELGILNIDYTYYCDEAIRKIKNAQNTSASYDLLITDLYFEKDYKVQEIADGTTLIKAVREIQPDLKVLVFSAESKPAIIEELFYDLQIDGYVRKARNDAKELKLAIEIIGKRQQYFPRHLVETIKQKNAHEFTDYDITIIKLLSQGISQKNIPTVLEQKSIRPSSLSSVEKRLNHIKTVLDCGKNEQLVAFCKDLGII